MTVGLDVFRRAIMSAESVRVLGCTIQRTEGGGWIVNDDGQRSIGPVGEWVCRYTAAREGTPCDPWKFASFVEAFLALESLRERG